jgi:hypothetical protein
MPKGIEEANAGTREGFTEVPDNIQNNEPITDLLRRGFGL